MKFFTSIFVYSCVINTVVNSLVIPSLQKRSTLNLASLRLSAPSSSSTTETQDATAEGISVSSRDIETFFMDQVLQSKTTTEKMQISTEMKEAIKMDPELQSSPPSPERFDGSGLFWRGVVIILCALWASNFAAAKLVMAEPGVDSSLYAVSRFGLSALALLPGSIIAIRNGALDWATAKSAAICGSWVAFGYIGQTIGLLSTTASKSCVICSLHCVFVATIAEFMRVSRLSSLPEDEQEKQKSSFDITRLIPAAVAVAGVAIIELKGDIAPTIGDLLSFSQPIGFGLGYLLLEDMMKERPQAALPVSFIKLAVVALASFTMFEISPLINGGTFEGFRIPDLTPIFSSTTALSGILYTGLITTAFALWIESIAFKRVPATDASLILTTEPLFAAAAAAYTLGETFGYSDYFGAALIIGACASSVLLEDASHGVESDEEKLSTSEI